MTQAKLLSAALGVEITDLDLRQPLSADQQAELRRLLDEYQVMVFRNQQISVEDQIRVLGIFGKVSDEERQLLARISQELERAHGAAAKRTMASSEKKA